MTMSQTIPCLTIGANLDSRGRKASEIFKAGFSSDDIPKYSTYNFSMNKFIRDSLGEEHMLMAYFTKLDQSNTWQVHIGIDGCDVTPLQINGVAGPIKLIFNSYCKSPPFILGASSCYHGQGPLSSKGTLSPAGTLKPLALGDLVINGEPVNPPTRNMDLVSTSDSLCSSISIAAAINMGSDKHGITAFTSPNNLDLGIFHQDQHHPTLMPGMMTINGVSITGGLDSSAPVVTIARYINENLSQTGIKASVRGASLMLTAEDGRNIHVCSETASHGSFANFDMTSDNLTELVKVGSIILSSSPSMNKLTLPYLSEAKNPLLEHLEINDVNIESEVYDVLSLVTNINEHVGRSGVLAVQSGHGIILYSHQSQAIFVFINKETIVAHPTFDTSPLRYPNRIPSRFIANSFANRMYNNDRLTLGGNAPSKVGLETGTHRGTVDECSEPILDIQFEYGNESREKQSFRIDLTGLRSFPSPGTVHILSTNDESRFCMSHKEIDELESKRPLGFRGGFHYALHALSSSKPTTHINELEQPKVYERSRLRL